MDAIPEWKDDKVARTEQTDLLTFAETFGFSAEEVNSVADHRMILLLRAAMLHGKTQEAGDTIRKKAKKGKVLRSGAPKRGRRSKSKDKRSSDYADARKRLEAGGGKDDAAAMIFETLES